MGWCWLTSWRNIQYLPALAWCVWVFMVATPKPTGRSVLSHLYIVREAVQGWSDEVSPSLLPYQQILTVPVMLYSTLLLPWPTSTGLILIDAKENTHTQTHTHALPWTLILSLMRIFMRHHLSAGCPSRKWALRTFQWRLWLCFQDASSRLHSHPVVLNVTFAHEFIVWANPVHLCCYFGKIKFPCHPSDVGWWDLQFHFQVKLNDDSLPKI